MNIKTCLDAGTWYKRKQIELHRPLTARVFKPASITFFLSLCLIWLSPGFLKKDWQLRQERPHRGRSTSRGYKSSVSKSTPGNSFILHFRLQDSLMYILHLQIMFWSCFRWLDDFSEASFIVTVNIQSLTYACTHKQHVNHFSQGISLTSSWCKSAAKDQYYISGQNIN